MFITGFTKTAGHLWDVHPEKGLHAKQDIHPRSNLGVAARGEKVTDLGKHVKHSENPNLVMKVMGRSHVFESNRHIPKGEELTVDFKTVPHLSLHKTADSLVSQTQDDVENDTPENRTKQQQYKLKVKKRLRQLATDGCS
jgi:hypothetical protein